MSGEPIEEAELLRLFEAARWAPSSANTQPWRILYARRDTAHWPLFFDLLVESNQIWCAARLGARGLHLEVDQRTTGKPAITNSYVTGRGVGELCPARRDQRPRRPWDAGLRLRPRTRRSSRFPRTFAWKPWPPSEDRAARRILPEPLRAREIPNGRRPLRRDDLRGPASGKRALAMTTRLRRFAATARQALAPTFAASPLRWASPRTFAPSHLRTLAPSHPRTFAPSTLASPRS